MKNYIVNIYEAYQDSCSGYTYNEIFFSISVLASTPEEAKEKAIEKLMEGGVGEGINFFTNEYWWKWEVVENNIGQIIINNSPEELSYYAKDED